MSEVQCMLLPEIQISPNAHMQMKGCNSIRKKKPTTQKHISRDWNLPGRSYKLKAEKLSVPYSCTCLGVEE